MIETPAASVDVEALKIDGQYMTEFAQGRKAGWNDCIDHLHSTGRLATAPAVPQDVLQQVNKAMNFARFSMLTGKDDVEAFEKLQNAETALAPFLKGGV